jgi:L-fuconolactonase
VPAYKGLPPQDYHLNRQQQRKRDFWISCGVTELIIDAHHHLWKYNATDYAWMSDAMEALRHDFLIAELNLVTRHSGVTGSVAVQARQTVEETENLLDLAAHHPPLLGVVGWVPLSDRAVKSDLERLSQNDLLKSVRHVLHDESDDFYMLREDFNRGVSLLKTYELVYDILIFERHLPQTIMFVDRHPEQKFVLDHIAKPRIRERLLSPWKEDIAELAKRENVYCKLSGLVTEADWEHWTLEDVRPYFDVVLSAFGPRRILFGSDWPVVTLAGGYTRWISTVHSLIAELSESEQQHIWSDTAIAAYGLSVEDTAR